MEAVMVLKVERGEFNQRRFVIDWSILQNGRPALRDEG